MDPIIAAITEAVDRAVRDKLADMPVAGATTVVDDGVIAVTRRDSLRSGTAYGISFNEARRLVDSGKWAV